MSYKTELQANNADLQTILAKVNELPEAGTVGRIFFKRLTDL